MTEKQSAIISACLLITAMATTQPAAIRGYASTPVADAINISKHNGIKETDPVLRQVWQLPKALKEISANLLLDEQRMACIEDNHGIIYIYNLADRKIEQTLPFVPKGDFEGLTKVGNTYYALRSDGLLYELPATAGKVTIAKTYQLPFTAENNLESLFYDKARNRLLVAVKEKDRDGSDHKGVYAFSLRTKSLNNTAICYIREPEDQEKGKDKKKKNKKEKPGIKPSDIAIHPITRQLYILNGPHAQLLIADSTGMIQRTIQLDKKILPQPEGLCFDAKHDLYISSEANKNERGTIALFGL